MTPGGRRCRSADRHVLDAVRHFATHATGASLVETDAVLLVASAVPAVGAFHCAALRTRYGTAPELVLAAAGSFAAGHGREVTVWASRHADADLAGAARTAGLAAAPPAVGMAITYAPEAGALRSPVDLVGVHDEAEVDEFAEVHRGVFAAAGRPPGAVLHFASPGVLLAPNVSAVVARERGRAVSCAMAIHTGRLAGVYWVATAPEFRRRGLGELVTRAVTRDAFRRGAQLVVLQATALGAPVYQAIGFRRFTTYDRYRLGVATAAP